MGDILEHQRQIEENLAYWNGKPVLRDIYRDFHRLLAAHLALLPGETVEIGSGIGNIREVIPDCVRTDLFPNPWIDRCEDVYDLRIAKSSAANIILFDVFHHLEFPLDALDQCHRALCDGGRLIIFDHAMSVAGLVFSKFCHHEREGFLKPYRLRGARKGSSGYYADHANADRILRRRFDELLASDWKQIALLRFPAMRWVLSGGYRGRDFSGAVPRLLVDRGEWILTLIPWLAALRMVVVMEKRPSLDS
jgi:hypothetical protein